MNDNIVDLQRAFERRRTRIMKAFLRLQREAIENRDVGQFMRDQQRKDRLLNWAEQLYVNETGLVP